MALEDITYEELFKSREGAVGPDEDTERIYKLEGSDDDVELKQKLKLIAPATVLDSDGEAMERDGGTIEQVGTELWIGRYRYAKQPRTSYIIPVGDPPRYTFDTTGGTQHITNSRRTMDSYAVTGKAPNFKGAIGVENSNGELTIAGCDIEVPVYNWEETHILSEETVTESYRVTLAILTGAVCNDTFRGFAAGTVMFRGARGSRRPDGNYEVAFAFSALPNVTDGNLLGEDFKVGDITVTTKKGWDYLWVYYEQTEETIASVKYQKKTPKFAYVERVRPYADFDNLDLPPLE